VCNLLESLPPPYWVLSQLALCRPDQGFYVWVVWEGEGGKREDMHVRIGNEASRRKEFPEFDDLLAEL